MQNNIKTAFILSIIGDAISEVSIYLAIFVFPNHYSVAGNIGAALLIMPILVAPIVLGSIALSLIRDVKNAKGGQKVLYIFTRVISVFAIVSGAILATIGLFVFGTSVGFYYQ